MDRANEENAIKLLGGLMQTGYTPDSANLDIWEDFKALAIEEGGDDKIADYDTEMFTLNMAVKVTLKDIEYWDNNDDILPVYRRLRDEVLTELNK